MARRRARSKVGLFAGGSNGTQEGPVFRREDREAGRPPAADLDAIPGVDEGLTGAYRTSYRRDGVHLTLGDALGQYDRWPAPVAISVDGPYGVSGFPGDPPTPEGLAAWYEPHVRKWSE